MMDLCQLVKKNTLASCFQGGWHIVSNCSSCVTFLSGYKQLFTEGALI